MRVQQRWCAVALGAAAVLLCILFDQLTKLWVVELFTGNDYYPVFSWLHIHLVWNTGVAFSLLSQPDWAWILLVAVTFLIGALWWVGLSGLYRGYCFHRQSAILLICAGGTANWLDRVVYGAVVDFVYLHYGDWYWPTIFNLADVYVVLGCLYYIAYDRYRSSLQS